MNYNIPDISSLRSTVDRINGFKKATQRRLDDSRQQIKKLEDESQLLDLVSGVFRTLIDKEILHSVRAVEKLLTEGMQAVFDDQDLKVTAEVKVLRGKVSVELTTSQKGTDGTVTEGACGDAFGGAVLTVQSILMRIIVMLRRGMRPVLLLDETLPALDNNYAANMGRFLVRLCSKLGIDILLVTHNPILADAAQRAYQIKKTMGVAKFEKIR